MDDIVINGVVVDCAAPLAAQSDAAVMGDGGVVSAADAAGDAAGAQVRWLAS
jgi:hypothetical protein